ncbi:MAG: hypothetical protein ACI35R_16680, partial [Bacillus sp. (in: firmicutes)]
FILVLHHYTSIPLWRQRIGWRNGPPCEQPFDDMQIAGEMESDCYGYGDKDPYGGILKLYRFASSI